MISVHAAVLFKIWLNHSIHEAEILRLSLSTVYLDWILSDKLDSACILCLYGQKTHLHETFIQNPNIAIYSIHHCPFHHCTFKPRSWDHPASEIALSEDYTLFHDENQMWYLRIIMDNNRKPPWGRRRLLWTFTDFCCNHSNG